MLAAALPAALLCARAGGRGSADGAWLAVAAVSAALIGAVIGNARIVAIDDGALRAAPGTRVDLTGFVAAVPRRRDGLVRVRIETDAGRLVAEAPDRGGALPVGAEVRVRGAVREIEDWERGYLRRLGVATVVRAPGVEPTGAARSGVLGLLDRARGRAEAALGVGTTGPAAALLRGFVIGADDEIDPATVEEFKRSGLAHLLAVSGQNIILLAALGNAVFAVLGLSRRSRLLWLLVLIAAYVPIAGGGASIQRAGVMGAAGVVAALGSRPASRWYALGLAAAFTLAIDPRACADPGWQLSFAAVAGIFILSAPLARLLGGERPGLRGRVAEGAALTIAASLATAPLMAFLFGAVSLVTLPANLAAAPAVAPVMWLGMAVAGLGQLTWVPVEPLTATAGALAGFVAQVAQWFAAPGWASAGVELPGPAALAAAYAALAAATVLVLRWLSRRRRVGPAARHPCLAALAMLAAATVAASAIAGRATVAEAPGLRVTFLDVGQGDAILLEPGGRPPTLVDAGPPGSAVAERLGELGVGRLGALVATHPEADHVGGAADVVAEHPAARLLFARIDAATLAAARRSGARPARLAAGDRWRDGRMRVDVLWPPAERLAAARVEGGPLSGDPNALALVLLVRWGRFDLLLAADAESELAPVDAGRVDVLKVAHHGSADAGLGGLLAEADPGLAVISVGAGNPYGHPDEDTLDALFAAGVAVRRTDLDGEVAIDVARSRWSVR